MQLVHETFFGIETPGQTYGVHRIVSGDLAVGAHKLMHIKLKLDISIDSSHSRQSRISSSVWTPNGWQQVVTIDGSDITLPKTDIGYVPASRSDEKFDVIEQIAKRLIDATLEVVA